MSNNTYMTIYENEYRTVELIIRDMEENDFIPTSASCIVINSAGTIVMSSTICQIYSNRVRITVPTSVTDIHGIYNIIWTISQSGKTYKHKTILNVEELS